MASVKMSCHLFRSFSVLDSSVLYKRICARPLWRSVSSGATESNAEQTEKTEAVIEPTPNIEVAKLESELKEQKEKLTSQLDEIKDKYQRSLAETENVRKRMTKQISDAKLFGIQGFCKDLLEVADILNKATDSVPKEEINSNAHLRNLYDGLMMTESQMQKVFVRHGLLQINPAEGEKFDPNLHEALFQQNAPDKEGDTVAVVTKIGYQLHHRTVRPALVGVYK